MIKIKHSKLKNTGLIYLVLVRNVSMDILLNKSTSPAISILKNNFKYGTQLNLEYLLYNILLTNKVKNGLSAQLLLTLILQLHSRLDKKKLAQLKYKVILQIKLHYNLLDLFLTRIPLYRVLASVYKIFLSTIITLSYDPISIMNAKQILLLHLLNTLLSKKLNDLIVLNFVNQDKDTQALAYKLVILRFNNKYGESFNLNQKVLLNKYMHSFSNIGILRLYLLMNVPVAINKLLLIVSKINDDIIKIKINLVLNQLSTITLSKIIKDSYVAALLKTYSLILLLLKIK